MAKQFTTNAKKIEKALSKIHSLTSGIPEDFIKDKGGIEIGTSKCSDVPEQMILMARLDTALKSARRIHDMWKTLRQTKPHLIKTE